MAKHSFKTLDGLRGVAACVVVVWHCEFLFGFKPSSGYLAVDLFFCLSGFVLAQAYGDRLSTGALNFTEFAALRIIRLYPLYLLGFLLMLASLTAGRLLNAHSNWRPVDFFIAVPTSLLFLPSPPLHSAAIYPFNNPAWSLFYEIVVNLAYAAAAPILTNSRLRTIVVVSAIALVCSLMYDGNLDHGGSWPTFFLGAPRVLFSFFAGVYLCDTKFDLKINPGLLLAALVVILWLDPGPLRPLYDAFAVLLLFPTLIVIARSNEPTGALNSAALALGAASYAIYMLHVPITAVIKAFQGQISALIAPPLSGVVTLIALFAICMAVDRLYDTPVRKWLNSLLKRHLEKNDTTAIKNSDSQ